MNTDKQLLCSDKQAVTVDTVSTDSILVTGLAGADRGRRMRAFCQIETGFTPDGAATGITFEVIEADNAALTAGVVSLFSRTVVNGAGAVNLAVGQRPIDVALPPLSKAYLGFRYTTNAGDYTAGRVTAGVTSTTDSPVQSRPPAESHGY
jgi:hypothetical protein